MHQRTDSPRRAWQLTVEHPGPEVMQVRLLGEWRLENRLPDPREVQEALVRNAGARRLTFEAGGVTAWDTGLVAFVLKLVQFCQGSAVMLGHTRVDTTQTYARIRPAELKRAVEFYEEKAVGLLDK